MTEREHQFAAAQAIVEDQIRLLRKMRGEPCEAERVLWARQALNLEPKQEQ